MIKSFNTKTSPDNVSGEDLSLINRFTQKELRAGEVFTFSVILCDNDIDRDIERFTVPALQKLAVLFVGKTAIRDHSMRSGDQSARTYKTEVVIDRNRKNSLGEDYAFLKAWCYMPKIEKNQDLIAEIRAGILKEVSIGCAVSKSVCSICGKDLKNGCPHRKGKMYGGALCYHELSEPTDAYEWSFVAVPAQKNAGVTKRFRDRETAEEELAEQLAQLKAENEELKKFAAAGRKYRAEREEKLVRLFAQAYPALGNTVSERLAKALCSEDLDAMLGALTQKLANLTAPQLVRETGAVPAEDTSAFKF